MSFPKIDACVVCEGARAEVNNKHILLGFFGIAPYTRVEIADFRLPVSLCFVFCGGGGQPGRFNLKLRLTDPRGMVVSNPQTSAEVINGELGPRTSTNVFLAFQGVVSGPGTYRAALIVDGVEHYSTTVSLEKHQEF